MCFVLDGPSSIPLLFAVVLSRINDLSLKALGSEETTNPVPFALVSMNTLELVVATVMKEYRAGFSGGPLFGSLATETFQLHYVLRFPASILGF